MIERVMFIGLGRFADVSKMVFYFMHSTLSRNCKKDWGLRHFTNNSCLQYKLGQDLYKRWNSRHIYLRLFLCKWCQRLVKWGR
jgi:hypothetical protein